MRTVYSLTFSLYLATNLTAQEISINNISKKRLAAQKFIYKAEESIVRGKFNDAHLFYDSAVKIAPLSGKDLWNWAVVSKNRADSSMMKKKVVELLFRGYNIEELEHCFACNLNTFKNESYLKAIEAQNAVFAKMLKDDQTKNANKYNAPQAWVDLNLRHAELIMEYASNPNNRFFSVEASVPGVIIRHFFQVWERADAHRAGKLNHNREMDSILAKTDFHSVGFHTFLQEQVEKGNYNFIDFMQLTQKGYFHSTVEQMNTGLFINYPDSMRPSLLDSINERTKLGLPTFEHSFLMDMYMDSIRYGFPTRGLEMDILQSKYIGLNPCCFKLSENVRKVMYFKDATQAENSLKMLIKRYRQ